MKFGIVALLAFLFASEVHAEVSFVAQVNAFAEAEDSAKAKDMAMLKANREAFLQVARRLTAEENVQELDKLSDDQLSNFVREVSVISEKISGQSYAADLNITVNGRLLKQYMQENGMFEVTKLAREALIIPLYAENEFAQEKLWEEDNPWRSAWLDKGQIRSGFIDFKLIEDTSDNREKVDITKLLMGDQATYYDLARTNRVRRIYVAKAEQSEPNMLVVYLKELSNGGEKKIIVFDEQGSVFDKAIARVITYVTDALEEENAALKKDTASGDVTVVYQYARLKDWLETERNLKNVPQIKSLQTGAAANGKVQLKMNYVGGYDHLVQTLENAGYDLHLDNGTYILQRKMQ